MPIDKTGVLLTKVFHLYKGGRRKVSGSGDFIKVSVRSVKPDMLLNKKQKTLALCTNTKFRVIKLDATILNLYSNDCLLLKRKMVLRSKDIIYPTTRKLSRKKLLYKFPGVL